MEVVWGIPLNTDKMRGVKGMSFAKLSTKQDSYPQVLRSYPQTETVCRVRHQGGFLFQV